MHIFAYAINAISFIAIALGLWQIVRIIRAENLDSRIQTRRRRIESYRDTDR